MSFLFPFKKKGLFLYWSIAHESQEGENPPFPLGHSSFVKFNTLWYEKGKVRVNLKLYQP